MMDVDEVEAFASRHGLWVVEDAAHAFPAAWRARPNEPWRLCGDRTARVSCFSFYANKTITTGEGGMAVTADAELADKIRLLSLHGLSRDAWTRYTGNGGWDYRILEPGYKYNMTDLAAAIGIHQVARAEEMRARREEIAFEYMRRLEDIEEVELPFIHPDRMHAWHLFPIRLRGELLNIDRNRFIQELSGAGIGCSVHWRPLHLHPYYEQQLGWYPTDLPVASEAWRRLISLPLFSRMNQTEIDAVVNAVQMICNRSTRYAAASTR